MSAVGAELSVIGKLSAAISAKILMLVTSEVFYNYILSYEKIFVKFINHKIFEKYKFFVQKCGLREISGTGCVAACAARDTQRHGRPFGRMLLGVA